MPFYKRKLFWLFFLISFTVILCRYLKINMHDEGFGKGWYYGDAFSERNVESAARFYLEKGFKPNCGLPTYSYNDSIQGNETVYTHYPPLAEWIGGVMAHVFNDYHDTTLSLLPLALSVLLFFLIYFSLNEIVKHSLASFIGASVLVLSNYFICWADDIHQHLYVEFCKWLFIYLWWRYLTSDKKRYHLIAVLALLYAAMCLLSFEPYVFTAIIIVGFSWVLQRRIFRWEVLTLLVMAPAMFWLRLNLNANFLGGYEAMIQDMRHALLTRTGGEEGYSELGRAMTWKDYLFLLPKTRLHRLGHFYILPSLTILYLGFLALRSIYSNNNTLFRLCIVCWLAAVSWIFVMPQHALIHIFTLRHIAVFIGLIIGFGILAYKDQVQLHFRQRNYLYLTLHGILISYSLVYALINTVYFIYIRYGLWYPRLGTGMFELWDSFLW